MRHYHGVMDEGKRLTLRLPAALHARIAEQAERDRRSLNAEIVYLLESAFPPDGTPDG
jgi:hypothetical protein